MSNGLYMREAIAVLCDLPQTELIVDSATLQLLSSSIKEPEERLNKVYLSSIRESFDGLELNAVHWFSGPKVLSDALTKDSTRSSSFLLKALASGKYEPPSEMTTNFVRTT